MTRLKAIPVTAVPCSYCGASAGQACELVLCPEAGPLSIQWAHNTRREAAA